MRLNVQVHIVDDTKFNLFARCVQDIGNYFKSQVMVSQIRYLYFL